MGILVLFISAMFIFGMMMFLESLKDGGESPLWGALWVVGMAAAFIPWSIKLARAEYRGKKLRGSPDPGNGNSISTTCPTTSSRESSNKGLDAHSDQDKGWLDFC